MSAVATLINTSTAGGDSWLVPTSAIQQQGDVATMIVVRNGVTRTVEVIPGAFQGEWTVVQSAALVVGDMAVGNVSSYVDAIDSFPGPPDGGMSGPPSGGGLGGPRP